MSPDHPGEAPARDPGPSETPHETLGRAVRAMTVETLSARRTPEAAAEAGRVALEMAEAAFARLRRDHEAVEREVSALPCRKYCAHCCYKTVSATPAEVLYLAARVDSEFAVKALAKLKARLRDLDARTRGMSPVERGRARLPCALLVARLCTAHGARPAACRGFNSRDVNACIRSLRQRETPIPVFLAQYRIFGHAHLGLAAGLADCGLRSTRVELTPALRIALETPDAGTRWLAGEPVFRPAELPPGM